MNLAPGRRLTSGPRDAYEVVGPGWSTDRHDYVHARKIFWNYRDADRALYESAEDERLGVLIRVPHIAPAADPSQPGRDLAFELSRVLGRPESPWFAEPLDVLDLERPDAPEPLPLLVHSDPHGVALAAPSPDAPPGLLLALAREALAMLAALEADGLAARGLDPRDWLLDPSGRWTFLGTHAIGPAVAHETASRAAWAALARTILDRLDDRGAELPQSDRAWLLDRLGRATERPGSVASLHSDRRRGRLSGLLRRACGRLRRLP